MRARDYCICLIAHFNRDGVIAYITYLWRIGPTIVVLVTLVTSDIEHVIGRIDHQYNVIEVDI